MTHKKQYDNAIPSSTDCNRYPRNDLELYNNHAENDRIFNPRPTTRCIIGKFTDDNQNKMTASIPSI